MNYKEVNILNTVLPFCLSKKDNLFVNSYFDLFYVVYSINMLPYKVGGARIGGNGVYAKRYLQDETDLIIRDNIEYVQSIKANNNTCLCNPKKVFNKFRGYLK